MIYKATEDFPESEEYGLKSQLRRAGVSYTSNIAEGFAKNSSKEKNKYYNTSQTSLIEIQNQILVARDVGYLSNSNFLVIANQTVVCHKLIVGLIRATKLEKYSE